MMADSGSIRPDDTSFTNAKAGAYRADVSVGLGDFFKGHNGRFTFYKQSLEAGYSAPGQATIKDTELYGGTFRMPVTKRLSLTAKGDQRIEDQGLETRAIEVDIVYKLTDRWSLSTGVRNDLRKDRSPIIPLTQEQGERTDAVVQVTFDRGALWRAYGFVQDTVAASGGREDNGRIGAGGSYRLTKRFRIDGRGFRRGTWARRKDRHQLPIFRANQSLPELFAGKRADGQRPCRGRHGNLVSGVKRRLSDSSSVYAEERYQNGASLDRSHARHRNQPHGKRTLEFRRQRRVRQAARLADRR